MEVVIVHFWKQAHPQREILIVFRNVYVGADETQKPSNHPEK